MYRQRQHLRAGPGDPAFGQLHLTGPSVSAALIADLGGAEPRKRMQIANSGAVQKKLAKSTRLISGVHVRGGIRNRIVYKDAARVPPGCGPRGPHVAPPKTC
jgi:hypothetical protein